MALDGKALAAALALEAPLAIHTELCRKEIGRFSAALGGGSCVVACTQEAPLFNEVAAAAEAHTDMKFINIRELAGWSAEGDQSTPKIAALLALAELPEPEPVPAVEYRSGGDVLIIGPAAATVAWAERLLETGGLQPSVLITDVRDGDLPAERRYPIWSGTAISIAGHLGAFEVEWAQHNPIDLEVSRPARAAGKRKLI